MFKRFSCLIVIILNTAFFKPPRGLLDDLLAANLTILVPFTLEPLFWGEKCLALTVRKTIAYFSGILDKSLDAEDFVFILFIICGKVGLAIFVEDEIHGSESTQEEKGFDYLPVLHYARAIKTQNFISLIAQVAKAMILHLFVFLTLDVHGD